MWLLIVIPNLFRPAGRQTDKFRMTFCTTSDISHLTSNLKSMSKKIIILIIIIIAALIITAGGYFGYQFYINHGIDAAASDNDAEKTFVVNKGENLNQIAENLEKEGLIKKALFFESYIKKEDLETKLQAGEYILKATMTPKEIGNLITGGSTKEGQITIPEGWKAEEIAEDLSQEGIISKQEFMNLVKKSDFDYAFLSDKPENASLEGYLFPDTYRIDQEANSQEIIQKMLDNFDQKLTQALRDEIKKQNKTIFEIVNLASIIEREVPKEKDRKIVAGIFYNRLDLGKALESCATIQYILGSNKKQFTYEETRTESPYNTYTNAGLTPGPICNPGITAIKAAISPQKTDYLYFLSGIDGKTYYAMTYEEHEVNKTKHLK